MLDTVDTDIPQVGAMPVISQAMLDEGMAKHRMFLRGQLGGKRAIFQYKDLSGLNFRSYDLSQSDFTGSILVAADLSLCTFKNSCFFGCDMRDCDLSHSDLSRTDLRGTTMSGANLSGANLADADMREGQIMQKSETGDLVKRIRKGVTGSQTMLTGARLAHADLSRIRARNADFSDTDMSSSVSHDGDFYQAVFNGANLSNADFSGSDLTSSNMQRAILSGIIMKDTENYNIDTSDAITNIQEGLKIEDSGQSLKEMLEEHAIWIKSVGKKGKQMDLSGYDMRSVEDLRLYPLTAIRAIKASFINLDLNYASIQSSVLDKSDFRDAYMDNSDLRGSYLRNAVMTRVSMRSARLSPLQFTNDDSSIRINRVDLSGADLRFSDLQNIDLRDAIMMGVDLSGANLSGADLRRADLTGAILKGIKLDDANLAGAIIDFSAI